MKLSLRSKRKYGCLDLQDCVIGAPSKLYVRLLLNRVPLPKE